MIIEMAVAQGILAEYTRNEAAAEKRRQHQFARTGTIAVAPESPGIVDRIASFVQRFRTARTEQAAPGGLAGEAAG